MSSWKRTPNYTLRGMLAAVIGFGWTVGIGFVFVASLPVNTMSPSAEIRFALRQVVPQGWRFFTRSAREEQLTLYLHHEGEWTNLSRAPVSRGRNAFGLNRAVRAQQVELGMLLRDANLIYGDTNASSQPCTGAPTDCLHGARPPLTLVNRTARPGICGTVGVVFVQPVPWSWRSQRHNIDMPSRNLQLAVACGETRYGSAE
jgi:antimicrobial peptide system SdpA family protein